MRHGNIAGKILLEQFLGRLTLERLSFLLTCGRFPLHWHLSHSYRRLPSRLIWPAPLTRMKSIAPMIDRCMTR